jgi:hypothetical protein
MLTSATLDEPSQRASRLFQLLHFCFDRMLKIFDGALVADPFGLGESCAIQYGIRIIA